MTEVAFRRLRLLVTKSCGITAHNMVPQRRIAGPERILSVPPICCSLARIAGIPTPSDIALVPCRGVATGIP